MFRRIYKKYKPALALSVISITSAIFSRLQEFVYASVVKVVFDARDSSMSLGYLQFLRLPDFCPAPPHYEMPPFSEDPVYYWTEHEAKAVIDIHVFYSPIFSSLFAGIYSDRYGGKNAVLAGLMLSGFVSTVLYSTMLRHDYSFLVMLILCSIGESMTSTAIWSLVGKWAMPGERTMFVSILFIGHNLGHFVGNLMLRIIISWSTACYICGFMNFFVTFWWWLIFRCRYIPETRVFKFIPFKEIIMSVSIYISSTLIIACSFTGSIAQGYFMKYAIEEIYIFTPFRISWIIVLMLALTKIIGHFLCGAVSDYVISEGLVSTSSLRRTVSGILFLFLYCGLLIARSARCNLELVLACCVILHFTFAVLKSTVYTVVLDITSAYSGVIFGIVIWISRLTEHKIGLLIINITDYGYSLKSSNNAFLLLAIAATGFTIPFLLVGVKRPSWGDGVTQRRQIKQPAASSAAATATVTTREDDPGAGPSTGHKLNRITPVIGSGD